jgi:hypothetical protein
MFTKKGAKTRLVDNFLKLVGRLSGQAFFLFEELHFIEIGIAAVQGYQLVMIPFFHYSSMLQNNDVVRRFN